MGLTVIAECPGCNSTIEHKGQYLSAVELATMEAWVIECRCCNHVFLHNIGDIEYSKD